jgi:hypothetical protein
MTNYFDLTGRSALVAGAAGGIGSAVAQAPAEGPTRPHSMWRTATPPMRPRRRRRHSLTVRCTS